MCTYSQVSTYTQIHTHIYTQIYIPPYACTHNYLHIYKSMHVSTIYIPPCTQIHRQYTYIDVQIYPQICTPPYACTHGYLHIHLCIHTYTNIHTTIFTYTQTLVHTHTCTDTYVNMSSLKWNSLLAASPRVFWSIHLVPPCPPPQAQTHHSPLCVKVRVDIGMWGPSHGKVAASGVNEYLQLLFLREKQRNH